MTDTTAVRWAKAEGQDGPVHAWLADQPTDRVWVSLCRWRADHHDLVDEAEGSDEENRCGNCRLMAEGLNLADLHGDDLAWRP